MHFGFRDDIHARAAYGVAVAPKPQLVGECRSYVPRQHPSFVGAPARSESNNYVFAVGIFSVVVNWICTLKTVKVRST